MGQDSKIEWTHHTFNPWWGCTKVSAGCTHCYADTLATRYGHDIWGPKADRRFFGPKHWAEPLKWQKQAAAAGERRRVFCASMADVFERHLLPEVDVQMDAARARLWDVIEQTPWLDWLLLTKRPENVIPMVPRSWLHRPPFNVWYGTSVENQEQAEKRIPLLLHVPATIRFLSCEPLLGPLNLSQMFSYPLVMHTVFDPTVADEVGVTTQIHWVIAGGESGPGARPMHPDWARSLRDQCQAAAGVAFHFKQWGEYAPHPHPVPPPRPDDPKKRTNTGAGCFLWPDGHFGTQGDWWRGQAPALDRVGKKRAGRELDGRTWDEFPEVQP